MRPDITQAPPSIFAALADPQRLGLLSLLADRESRSIAALAAPGAITRQAVTKHLQVLESAGLVVSLRVGRERRYALQPAPLLSAAAFLHAVAAQWDEGLARLKAQVETDDGRG
jgi:DNA-binding transcriptional ArsR family regulator